MTYESYDIFKNIKMQCNNNILNAEEDFPNSYILHFIYDIENIHLHSNTKPTTNIPPPSLRKHLLLSYLLNKNLSWFITEPSTLSQL